MFLKLILISAILLLIAFAGLGLKVLMKPGSRFPEIHIGRNKEMRKRGITCAKKTDVGCSVSPGHQGCLICEEQEEE